MKFDKKKLLTTVSAAALVLAVGACGSSSDDETAAAPRPVTTEPAPEPTPELTPAEQLTAAQAALTMAQGLVDALTSASSAEDAAAAYGALGAAQAALHAATNLPPNQIAALQAQINQLVLDLEAANAIPSTETVALETAQADAATAAMEAMEAATAAKVASDAAQTARENFATLQTGETSGDLAHAAYMQAKAAADAAAEAQTASDNAAEATDSGATTRLLVAAEAARDNAVEAKGNAETHGAAAVAAAMAELLIDGTVKTVGTTSLDATAASSVVTTDGDAVETGLLPKDDQPMHTALPSTGEMGVEGNPGVTANPYKAPVAVAVGGMFPIGKLVDSADDLARLMIVTQYGGSKTVKVYSEGTTDTAMGTKAGFVSINLTATVDVDEEATNANNVALKREGTYYPAGDPDGMLEQATDTVAFKATGKEVFSYVDPNIDAADPQLKTYVVLKDEVKTGTTTVYNYVNAVIHVMLDRDGPDADTYDDMHEVTAKIPEATNYDHIHFGVWAALEAPAEKDGKQELSDLGIGFVQNFSGGGLTSIGGTSADMPNGGKGIYKGNWVAAVQRADEDGNGAISLVNNAAELEADFSMGEITATLTDLATLTGDIAGNTFSGTKATVVEGNTNNLDSTGKFTGTFSGGFYGAKAVEAGGIFDFTSEGAEDGAFRGAFGGKK